MTASFVAATSPNGELHVRKFSDVVSARCYELALYMNGWDTRPVLTVHDDNRIAPCRYCSEPSVDGACEAHDDLPALERVDCVVCLDAGCPHCPKVDA